jgi:hypothetical protein
MPHLPKTTDLASLMPGHQLEGERCLPVAPAKASTLLA